MGRYLFTCPLGVNHSSVDEFPYFKDRSRTVNNYRLYHNSRSTLKVRYETLLDQSNINSGDSRIGGVTLLEVPLL